jgi:PST family polysaccharide transporter
MRDLWSYGRYTFLLRVAAFIANQSPRIVVGYLLGPAALGAFSLGLRIVEMMYQLLSLPASNVAMPLVAKIREDRARLEKVILSSTQLTATLSAPAFMAFALVAPILVPILFGPRWSQSISIVQLLALAGLVGAPGFVNLAIVTGLGRPDINLGITVTAAITSVGILALTAPWGVVAATSGFAARGYFSAPLTLLLIAKLTGIPAGKLRAVYYPIIGAVVVMAALMAGVLWACAGRVPPPVSVALALVAGASGYLGALYLFARPVLTLATTTLGDLRQRRGTA